MSTALIPILLIPLMIYCFAVVWMWVRQDSYLFVPHHDDVVPEFERYRWDRSVAGVKHQGWFIDKGADKTVIYHGGNAEDLASHCEIMFRGLDFNALLVNYRGYGQSEGTPSEKTMVSDCIAILDLFCEEQKVSHASVFLMGRSLGSGVSVQVATARPDVGGVILVTPYESIAAIAKFQYPWLPIEQMLRHPFRSIDHAPRINIPALVLLAEFDAVIPVESGQKLGEVWGGPKEIITLPADHRNINEHPDYFNSINRFVGGAEPARSTSRQE